MDTTRDRDTLVEAARDGGMLTDLRDTFVLAEEYDGGTGRYLGLRAGGGAPIVIDNNTDLPPNSRASLRVRI